jgi:hypothetical protein
MSPYTVFARVLVGVTLELCQQLVWYLYRAFYAHGHFIYISFMYWTVAQGSGDARARVTTIPIMYLRSRHG